MTVSLRQRRHSEHAWTVAVTADRARCPRPDKAVYVSKRVAKRALGRFAISGRDGLHAYRCPCGFWHLGHKRTGGGAMWGHES